ncbi:hypothetical protein [Orbus mooreae]|uniref:hypothetical protein n=1 Tax=Orbus mooreae TaxID=3074107 RepID=UPI00370DB79F
MDMDKDLVQNIIVALVALAGTSLGYLVSFFLQIKSFRKDRELILLNKLEQISIYLLQIRSITENKFTVLEKIHLNDISFTTAQNLIKDIDKNDARSQLSSLILLYESSLKINISDLLNDYDSLFMNYHINATEYLKSCSKGKKDNSTFEKLIELIPEILQKLDAMENALKKRMSKFSIKKGLNESS